jgi:hypothetical protein
MISKVTDPITNDEREIIASPLGGYRIISTTSPDLKPGEVRFFVKQGVLVVGAGEGVDVITPKAVETPVITKSVSDLQNELARLKEDETKAALQAEIDAAVAAKAKAAAPAPVEPPPPFVPPPADPQKVQVP